MVGGDALCRSQANLLAPRDGVEAGIEQRQIPDVA
jgi:hypothetical protein